MDSKIKQYLFDIAFLVDKDQYNKMKADADKLDTKTWLNKYQASQQSNDVLAATWNKYGFDTYSKDKYDRYRDTFGSSDSENPFNKPDAWLKAKWTKDYQDMSFEDFKNDISTMSKYWEDEKRAREYEAGKKKREKEVKEWPLWKDILASEYSKQRYINEPEKSLFSDEGKWYNKGDDISDFAYGGAGAVADLLPGYGIFVGPAVRAARDVQHKVTDSPYQKDWSNIGQDAFADAAINAGIEYLPNLRRYMSMAKRGAKESPVSTVLNLEDDVRMLRDQVDFIDNSFNGGNYAQLLRNIESLPESEFKTEMRKHVKDIRNIDEDGIAETIANWRNKTNYMLDKEQRKIIDYARQDIDKTAKLEGADNVFEDPITKRMILAPELNKAQKVGKAAVRTVEKAAKEAGPILREIDTAKGRGSKPEVDDKLTKDWYKQNYERDWKMGFKPNEKEGDLLWEAYKEWTEGK